MQKKCSNCIDEFVLQDEFVHKLVSKASHEVAELELMREDLIEEDCFTEDASRAFDRGMDEIKNSTFESLWTYIESQVWFYK